ncbi:alcohol dehydrogenase (cytochrome c)/quinohemoprotein ethanol dehydrogenase [Povalibacter uvarum]|uniref:Alcohol dehydrogenase (Cytochrome c)/quinohemoprotein ethanol dehydrogenase n=1 Tax=Povalibacter uvarum TaxID=732238 RepID=A0A841HMJ9_9GAMM|nr:PQQ-dependent dehydrogenase, methanol/ethanol family [Povalibacter uvarum]MBB6093312.1 alcohol dehydrogenase (cytochrome c)/quinohemoprotein ethanol dehydrogenase [Povalibacter uvarum]
MLNHSPVAAAAIALILSVSASAAPVDANRIVKAGANNSEWVTHGRTYDEQRYSPLARVTQDNVGKLGLAWYFDLDTSRGQEATPLLVDGTLYFTSAWSKAFAVDARTGKEKWRFDPQIAGDKAIDACCDVVNRGVAAWGDKVFLGTLDGRLIALDMATGKPVWSVQTTDPTKRYTITGAPRIIKGKVIIGNGGGEMGVRGFITAYDAATGKQLWRFHTVPGNPADGFENKQMEEAAKTWNGEWWKYGGGGTVWDSMAYDEKLDLLYIGVGNGSPWNHQIRSAGKGDNLFLSSIVALKPDSGEYVWHFQTTPGESWDYTATQHIILADMKIGGVERKVLMQAPKNGFFYVLDRVTGKFISGNNYVAVNWAKGLDPQTGRPIDVPEARYTREPAMVTPSAIGGHNWFPMSYSPLTGLVYVPTQITRSTYATDEKFEFRDRTWNTGIGRSNAPANPDTVKSATATEQGAALLAWDPVAQREVWRVSYPRFGNGGTLATGGSLVFQGSVDGHMNAYAADTGAKLWSYATQNAVMAGPITYELDGEQYVTAVAGIGGVAMGGGMMGDKTPRSKFGRLLVFKLGGTAALPSLDGNAAKPLPDLANAKADGDATKGKTQYDTICSACHGAGVVSTTTIPDLRYAKAIADAEAFKAIVLDGALASKGMVGFGAMLKREDAEAIRAYLVSQSKLLAPAQKP